ncbi:MAG: MFS transporter [Planctomycetota bacterium]|nr:MFS transporter [Planctomycetota bacterium]
MAQTELVSESLPSPHTVAPDADPAFEARTVRKVMLRLIPFIVVLYIMNYLDRVNVAFAKLTMNADLGFSEEAYGFGAGVFFVSYFLFEVPSNLIMQRVGARLWMARIMISWGLISSAMIFVEGPLSFYALRFLLGAAEAGFAPGILLYLTYWVPVKQQGRAVAWFLTSTALAGLVGSPLAGLILSLDGAALFGWRLVGWQWLFLLEGIPSVIGGFTVLWLLTDRPEQASWLKPKEREWLSKHLEAERRQRQSLGHTSLRHAFANRTVWLLTLNYCALMFAFQGMNYFMPTVIKEATGIEDNQRVGLLTAIPYFCAMVSMVIVGRHSDRTGERRWHVAACTFLGALGLSLCAQPVSGAVVVAALAVAAVGLWSMLGPFWAMPPTFLTGTAAAAGIALINSVGNLGGFLAPYAMGALKDRTRSCKAGLVLFAAVLVVGGCLTLCFRRVRRPGALTGGENGLT